MFVCLICHKVFEKMQGLGIHIVKQHSLSVEAYNDHFGMSKHCPICGFRLLDENTTGFCNKHRNRSGKNNPFYGKHHSQETIDRSRSRCSEASKNNWKNLEYRNKVIRGMSKHRSKEFGQQQSLRVSKMYEEHPEQRIYRSISMKRSWQEGRIVSSNFSSNRSKLQMLLLNDVNVLCNNTATMRTVRTVSGKYLFPDIVIEDLGLVIEFYGNFWHANPKFYKADDIVCRDLTAQKVWDADDQRLHRFDDILTEDGHVGGYTVVVVWEEDYTKDRLRVLRNLDMLINYESCVF